MPGAPGLPDLPDAQGGGRSTKVAQVEALVARTLRERLARGLNDPRVQGMVSVIGVDLTPDLAMATVRVTVLPEDRERLTLSGLRSAARHLESFLRKATRLRRVPKLTFEIDERMKREVAVLAAIQSIAPAEDPSAHPTSHPSKVEPP